MHFGSWRNMACAVVLLWLAHPTPVAAANEVAYIPGDAQAFVTVRPAELLGKLGATRNSLLVRSLGTLQQDLGISLQQVERLTVVKQTADGADVIVLTCRDKIDRDKVVKAMLSEDAKKEAEPREMFVATGSKAAVHFVGDKSVVFSEQADALKTLLIALDQKKEMGKELEAALCEADTHDVFAWSLVVAGECKRKAVCCYYGGSRGRCCSALAGLTLAFTEFPMPDGAESAWTSVDFGDQMQIQVRVQFEDSDSAKEAVKPMRAAVDLLRGQVLMMASMVQLAEVVPDLDLLPRGGKVPTRLLTLTSKALEKVRVRAVDAEVPVGITIPVTAKEFRKEIEAFARLKGDSSFGFDRWLPAPAPCRARAVEDFPQPLVAPPSVSRRPYQDAPVPHVYAVPPPPVQVEPKAFTLTVANVRKEPASVYRLDEKGKMVFVKKLPPGEAFDSETKPETRWLAVFGDKQDGESFVIQQEKSVWLLRSDNALSPEAPRPVTTR